MTNTPEDLRSWAKGSLPQEAATELLLRAFEGRFAAPGRPWMIRDAAHGSTWIDFSAIPEYSGGLSGGERRFLDIVASLGGDHEIPLADVLPGLDRALLDLVLAAFAHAAGSHQHSVLFERPGGILGTEPAPPLHPWPRQDTLLRVINGGRD